MSLDTDDDWKVTLTGGAVHSRTMGSLPVEKGGIFCNQGDANQCSAELFLCDQCRDSAHNAMNDFSRYAADHAHRMTNPAHRSMIDSTSYGSRALYEGRLTGATAAGAGRNIERNVGCTSSHTMPSQMGGKLRPLQAGVKVDHAHHLGWLASQANIYQHTGYCRRQPLR